ncbi:aspartate kinase [Macrococcoides canis]|uniref:Aspartokinase n=1 Tax=Macrococcoides canis TaxID=1855823 RepID=A0A4R6C745_9STAP|nr:aspartate kinase [Macrococcus canis]MEE1107355.1 aspartate kinase [Macrococcus canis]TDM18151.1 aspartate kinase [Macrococcus canis]TDM24294.1 aspartate kinase [Macrococcus canis]TDM32748.1 aspartate kinase [Macrococcus canis]TDM34625.1 aspartate kinase [Macrococcus canis]
MKVCKFGGSSVADAQQIKKILKIINEDNKRKYIVVSAPGKRYKEDVKVTDMLIALIEAVLLKKDHQDLIKQILDRFQQIERELNINHSLIETFRTQLNDYIKRYQHQPERLTDALKSCGEDFNAQLIANYNNEQGIKTTYFSPGDIGLIVSDEPSNSVVLEKSYENIMNKLVNVEGKVIIPGFFGINENGDINTFSRGGSDITGAIIASSVNSDVYENFTDVSGIFSANPNIVNQPASIIQLTYEEMRELSYAGFSVFHDEALLPVYRSQIPVNIKNTNDPDHPGTLITNSRQSSGVVGVSCDSGFVSINMKKYLMNREIGFTRRLLSILEDMNISYEHMPSGIDDISVILRAHQLEGKEAMLLEKIEHELKVDALSIEKNIAILMVVGLGMKTLVGTANKATEAFKSNNINLKMINQGSSEISMMFGIEEKDADRAVLAAYEAYFA